MKKNICEKRKRRTFFDLFKVYDCTTCIYNQFDEYIKIGYQTIYVYYISNSCINVEIKSEYNIFFNKKLGFILNKLSFNNEYILLFFDDSIFEDKYDDLDILLKLNIDIIIISL